MRGEFVQAIIRQGHRMAKIIDELLLLARLRSMDKIDTRPLAMAGLVAGALDSLRPQVDACQAEIHLPAHWP